MTTRTGAMVVTSDKARPATRELFGFGRPGICERIGKVLRVDGRVATVRLHILVEQDWDKIVDVQVATRELRELRVP